MVSVKRLFTYALFPIILYSSIYAVNHKKEASWKFTGGGNDVRCYDVKNGKEKMTHSSIDIQKKIIKKQKGNSVVIYSQDYSIDKMIEEKNKYITNLPAKFDYTTALYNWRYFDGKKAGKIADKLIKQKKMRLIDRQFFIDACKAWPFVKFYSKKCSEEHYLLDDETAYVFFTTENRFGNERGKCGEIGPAQLMPGTIKKGIKTWRKSPYWVDGENCSNYINNLLGGMRHMIECEKQIGCKKNLESMTNHELKKIYSVYVSGDVDYDNSKYWIENIAGSIKFLKYLPAIDSATANGNLINKKGRNKLKQIRIQKMKKSLKSVSEAKIFKYALNLK